MHNLTQKQLEALRWFMERIENGVLEETFLIGELNVLGGAAIIMPRLRGEDIPKSIDIGVINALVADGVFIKNGGEYTVSKRPYELVSFAFSNPPPVPVASFMKETHQNLLMAFNREELRRVCFELGINPDWVFGDKTDWPFELLHYLYRQNRLDELTPILVAERPNIQWPLYPNN